jgi:hypothetical protein
MTSPALDRLRASEVVNSNPVSFLIGGRQHVAIPAGRSIYVFGLFQARPQ